jgi:hypothetical protein
MFFTWSCCARTYAEFYQVKKSPKFVFLITQVRDLPVNFLRREAHDAVALSNLINLIARYGQVSGIVPLPQQEGTESRVNNTVVRVT